ncbi:MAG: hypothetical protein ACLSVG_08975 [Clostridia bacterium]
MNKQKFKEACQSIIHIEREQNGIGTLGEKTLHAVLKQYYEPDKTNHERKVGSFVADIVTDSGIIEIQTRAFDKLRKKLAEFLEIAAVTVVYPIPKTKWLLWIDEQTGETTKKRKSPRQGRIFDIIPELYKIKFLLKHNNFRLCIVFIDMEEYRYLNGWSKDKKKGSTRCDRVPIDIADEIYIDNTSDYIKFIPDELSDGFTSKDYKNAAHINLHTAQTALNILNHIGVVRRVGKQGGLYVYERRTRDE